MKLCGIDVGYTGAIAFYDSEAGRLSSIVDMPLTDTHLMSGRLKRGRMTQQLNWWAIGELLRVERPDLVLIEGQRSMHAQGIVSAFNLGAQYGALRAIAAVLDLPHQVVWPEIWKPAVGLRGESKEASRQKAKELMPEAEALLYLKKHHNRAEAALLALWKARYETAPVFTKARPNFRSRPTNRPRRRGEASFPRRGKRKDTATPPSAG